MKKNHKQFDMKSILSFFSIFLFCYTCPAQQISLSDFLKDSSISDCRKIDTLREIKEFKMYEILPYIQYLSEKTSINASLSPSSWIGLIYVNRNDFLNDLEKWRKKLKCPFTAQGPCSGNVSD
jgi:hypothetical protein